ncbi:MFS monocarboxylate transporter-like protein [Hortaea werneckii]|nr:MFS monocarboxylate transporter-like protein [Hortaea werneckii]KAI7463945.1 MFS monocarboxylate transporter-like protein [Hortaea werneckii]KAI7480353.1 MFS monocarboxylate transporter-like protein [Hortaea werneckii]
MIPRPSELQRLSQPSSYTEKNDQKDLLTPVSRSDVHEDEIWTQQPSVTEQTPVPIPNGGLWAWLQVLSGFMLFMNSWGLLTSFGVFQQYYSTTYIPETSESTISWIGTLASFMLSSSATFAGPILDRGHPRLLLICGTFCVVFGLMMTSLADRFWQLLLAQGICTGIGSGQLFIVSVALLPQWFTTKRSTATGIAATGSSAAAVIYPPMFHYLIDRIGFGWTVRSIAFVALAVCLVSLSVARMRTQPPPRPKIVDFSGFKEPEYALFALVSFFGGIGLFIPFFYITQYCRENVGGISDELAFWMLPILGVGSIFGRTIPAIVADKAGNLNVLAFCTIVSALLGFCWIAVDSIAGIIIWSLFYGCFSGAFVSLQVPTVVSITQDPKTIGGRAGTNNLTCAFGILIGNPIGGVIVKRSWVGLQTFCGATLVTSAAFIILTRLKVVGISLTRKT